MAVEHLKSSQAASLAEPRSQMWLIFALFALSTLPCLAFQYLPMTDLPQHEAIVSIMRHMHDPSYGFDRYYQWALGRTLYVFPYFLAVLLAFVVPVRLALHLVVFIAALSYPLGVLLTLRALKRPLWISLLALPLVYNRAFFWGFVNFNLGMGIAFIALSLLVGVWSNKKGIIVALLCLLSAVTHVYGLLLLASYVVVWFLCGDRRALLFRVVWMLPAFAALAAWALFAANAPGYGITEWLPFELRLKELGHSIFGGYVGSSEDYVLLGLLVVLLVVSFRSLPITISRWRRLGVHGRASTLLVLANLVAYFLLPMATPTAKFIHFRHAVIAAMLLPLVVAAAELPKHRRLASVASVVVALAAAGNTWWHFNLFEHEAHGFDAILAAVPERANIVQLTYDSKGGILRSHAYLHFGAYAQARKGGVIAVSFPILFWNIPLKARENTDRPDTPKNLEWAPGRYSERRMGNFYDTILVRQKGVEAVPLYLTRAYDVVASSGPWKLLHRAGPR